MAEGSNWYRVSATTPAATGWVDGQFLAAAPPLQGAAALGISTNAWVAGTQGAGLRVHSAPLVTSNVLGTLSDGTPVQVLEGPIAADGYNWWRISATTPATVGWAASIGLSPTPP